MNHIDLPLSAVLLLASALPLAADEAPFAFRRELERVHEPGLRIPSVQAGTNDFVFADGCAVGDADFADFLWVSLGVRASAGTSDVLSAAVDGSLPSRAYEIAVSPSGVRLRGADTRALRQAYCRLEQRLALRGGPFLACGVEWRRPLFETRMTHSAWRVDRFPDDYLDRIVHAGFDSVMIFLKDVGVTRAESGADIEGAAFSRDDGERPCEGDVVSDVIRRAAAKGLDTWLYSYVRAPVHPDDPDADARFEAAYGRIARVYPDARGLVLVGESVQFPSRDPRTSLTHEKGKFHPGSFPCSDYPAWLEGLKRAVRRHAPKMDVVFWSYNWGWVDEEPRLALLEKLPKDVIAMATFEMFETARRRNGLLTRCDDYSLSFPLPGRYYLSEAEAAKRFGLKFYAMTCTSGLTWDLGTAPCEPVPQLWKDRFDAVADSAHKHGLAGLMENHSMGWTPSFISELENEAFTEGGQRFDEMMVAIARRDFGSTDIAEAETNVTKVIAAWDGWSRALRDMVPMVENQYGPLRVGPAYPFNYFGRHILKSEVPQTRGYSGVLFCDLNYNEPLAYCRDSSGTERPFDADEERQQAELFEHMAWAFDCGVRVFESLDASRQTPRQRHETARMARWGRYWSCSMRTTAHVKRGLIAYRRGDRDEVERLAAAEYANAQEALRLVRADSRLGFEPAAGYIGGPDQIEWKLRRMRELYRLP